MSKSLYMYNHRGRIRSGRQLAVPVIVQNPCRLVVGEDHSPMALDGSDPSEPEAKTFVWRSQDLKAFFKVDGQIFLPKMTVGALPPLVLDQPRRLKDIFLEIWSRLSSSSLRTPSWKSGRSAPIIQRTSNNVGAGSAAGLAFGSGLAEAPDSRMNHWSEGLRP